MLRLVRSALRTADRLVHTHSSSPTAKLKQPLNNLTHNLRGGATHTNISGSRSLSTSTKLPYTIPRYAHQSPPFKSTLSLPARVALGKPLSTPFLPRTPAVPRCVTLVGLGTARNFSSTRHVFQNLVDNVPIAGRAWYEAGWEVKTDKKRSVMRRTAKKAKKARLADKVKAKDASMAFASVIVTSYAADELSQYFDTVAPTQQVAGATTYLTVPLYPTSQRRPLPRLSDSSSSRLLPLSELKDLHGDHSLHAVRVSSLFTRLDTADVWSHGVECECYGGVAMPTALHIVFHGWTKDMVLDVIGEAGQGWCELTDDFSSTIEGTTLLELHTIGPGASSPMIRIPPLDQANPNAMSFVIPTLDFSSSFLSHSPSTPSIPSINDDHHIPTSPYMSEMSEWTPFSTLPPSPAFSAVTEECLDDIVEEMSVWSDDELEVRSIKSSVGFSSAFMSRDMTF